MSGTNLLKRSLYVAEFHPITSSRYYFLSNVWIDGLLMQWRHYSFALIHVKVKHDFQVANQEISFENVYMIQNSWQNCFTLFDRNSDMFNV